jgi:hypothetical protein
MRFPAAHTSTGRTHIIKDGRKGLRARPPDHNGGATPPVDHRKARDPRLRSEFCTALNRRVMKAYLLKETLDRLWSYTYEGAMLRYLQVGLTSCAAPQTHGVSRFSFRLGRTCFRLVIQHTPVLVGSSKSS